MDDQDFLNYQQGFLPVAAQVDEDHNESQVAHHLTEGNNAPVIGVEQDQETIVAQVQQLPEAAAVVVAADDDIELQRAEQPPAVPADHVLWPPPPPQLAGMPAHLDPWDDDDDDDDDAFQNLGERFRRREQRRRLLRAHQAGGIALAQQQQQQVGDTGNDEHDDYGQNLQQDQELQGLDANVSSYLFDLIREDRTCTNILSGWSMRDQGCNCVVQRCQERPEEAFYVSLQVRNPIHEACLRNACRHVVKALLAANSLGASDTDDGGNTALHLLFMDYSSSMRTHRVCPQEMDRIVGDLLAINPAMMACVQNSNLNTPLHIACMAPETMVDANSILQLLKANPACASIHNVSEETPLRLHCQRRNASTHVAKLLLEAYPEALRILDRDAGWAPIHYAASNANFELLRYLVTANPDAAKIRTSKNETALHLLCRQHAHFCALPLQNSDSHDRVGGSTEILAAIELLLQVDPDAALQRDSVHLHTPLHLVCKQGDSPRLTEVVTALLRTKPDAASSMDCEDYLPLHHACEIGCNVEVVKILLDNDAAAAMAMTRKQDSALSLACSCNKSVETVKVLIDTNPLALTRKNDYGFAPLHCICRAYQPRMGIVQALIEAKPSCVHLETNAGETPVHLLSSNSGAFVGILQLLTDTQNKTERYDATQSHLTVKCDASTIGNMNYQENRSPNTAPDRHVTNTNKIGNTPLHDACFRGSSFEHIETLAMANPKWLSIRNNAGYTALQILCKIGRLDKRIISTFVHVGGPEVFAMTDDNRFTPLHSAIREDTHVATLKCLIRAFPDALRFKTIYGDTPLHLACFRKANADIVRELVMGSSSGDASLVLERNLANHTPIGLAIEEYRSFCRDNDSCCVSSSLGAKKVRAFRVLATLVKILYYGPVKCQIHDAKKLNLLHASVALHRQGIRLDPAFIRRVIHEYPEEVRAMDSEGNFPLHIEAGIPIEKMSLLDGRGSCCEGKCHERAGILRLLLDKFPDAARQRNEHGHFPLGLMIDSGRRWGQSSSIPLALRAFPPALHWYKNLDNHILPSMLERVERECGTETLFSVLRSCPEICEERS